MDVKYGHDDRVKWTAFEIFHDADAWMWEHPLTILELDIKIHRLLRRHRIFNCNTLNFKFTEQRRKFIY
jgi:hypothetical protein